MPKFKVVVPFVVNAESEEEAQINATSALASVDENNDIEFLLDEVVESVEPMDEDEEDETPEGEEEEDSSSEDESEDDDTQV